MDKFCDGGFNGLDVVDLGVKRYIITGGPGSGKSTLLDALAGEGFPCFREVSREIIREQQSIGGNLLPWGNLHAFARECYRRMQQQICDSSGFPFAFFDRGIPDVAACLNCAGLPVPQKLREGLKWYDTTVFICPPWQEIYVNDPQRPESFEHSVRLYHHLVLEYTKQGARLVNLPRGSVAGRAEVVLRELKWMENKQDYSHWLLQ